MRGRQGEFNALAALDTEARGQITPLLEVPPVAWDFEAEEPAKSLEEHLAPLADKIATAWGNTRHVFVDLAWIPGDEMADGSPLLTYVMGALRSADVAAIPVTGLERPTLFSEAARDTVDQDRRGVCLRLEPEDLRRINLLPGKLERACADLGVGPGDVDLILDFKAFDSGQAPAIEMAAGFVLIGLPSAQEWRSVTLAGGAFPLNLSGVKNEERIPRADWDTWRAITIDRADELPRRPAFADYAVQHPEPQEVDPRLMRMSANARYATQTEWLILKKKNVRDHGFEQFHDISAELASRPEFRGAHFSAGDRMICDCADRTSGPGNATTWRTIATNHHIATVIDQIANLF